MSGEELKRISVETRRPSSAFPGGAIQVGAYREDGNTVVLYDETGKTILSRREIVPPLNARETAARMLKERQSSGRAGGFGGKLSYEKLRY